MALNLSPASAISARSARTPFCGGMRSDDGITRAENAENAVGREGRKRRSAARGFTLIELMVALAVFSLAAITLLRVQGVSSRTASELEVRTIGQIVANNVAAVVLSDPVLPTLGTTTGAVQNGGLNWRWTRTTQRTADVRIARIDIAVATDDGRPGGALSVARTVK